MGKSVAKYRPCRRRCRCKINNLIGEEIGNSILLSFMALRLSLPLSLLQACSSLTHIRLPHPLSPFLLPCSTQTSVSLKLPGCLGPFSASEIASDAHPVASAAELLSHRRILALGLTERLPPRVSLLVLARLCC